MRPEILFLSIDGMTDPLGQSQVIPYLEGLAGKGFDITIISCEKQENFSRNEKTVRAILTRANIGWEYCFYSKKIPLLSQRGNLQKLKKLALAQVKKKGATCVIHCRSYLAALAGLHLKKKLGCPYIFDMRGFWADERVEGGIWKLKNPLHKTAYNYFKRKEKEMVATADHIVTLTESAKKIITGWNPGKKITVIPCCADLDHFKISAAPDKAEARKKNNIPPTAFVWGYLGSLGTWYMLDEMFDFFNEYLKKDPEAILFFVTPDKAEPILASALAKDIPADCIRVQAAKRAEVPSLISTFNAGIFFIRPTFSKKGSSPTKMAEILGCGIPVLTNSGVGDCDDIIKQSQCGVVVQGFTPAEYQHAIVQVEKMTRMAPGSFRQAAQENFSLQKGVASYKKIYKDLSATHDL